MNCTKGARGHRKSTDRLKCFGGRDIYRCDGAIFKRMEIIRCVDKPYKGCELGVANYNVFPDSHRNYNPTVLLYTWFSTPFRCQPRQSFLQFKIETQIFMNESDS